MPLRFEAKAGYALATMVWPDDRCLLDAAVAADLASVCESVRDAEYRALVLTAEGPTFCRGATNEPADIAGRPPAVVATGALAVLATPVVCAIEGDAWDEGLELALACDLRVAGGAAAFQMGHLDDRRVPQAGGTQRLPRIAGKAVALQMLLLAETVRADQALSANLVQRVTAAGGALIEAESIATRLASGAPIAARFLKEAVVRGMEQSMAEGLQLEADLYFLLQTTEDRAEGIRAFQEKRAPEFHGR